MKVLPLALVVCVASVVGFSGGGDDRFIKKYAMMKVYESCFGPEVVKEVRKEMRMACAKCAAMASPAPAAAPAPSRSPSRSPKPRPKPSTQAEALEAAIDAAKFQQTILALSKRVGQQQAQVYQPTPYNPYPGYYQAPQAPNPSWTPQAAFSPPGYFAYYQSPAAAYPAGGYYPTNPGDFYQSSRSMNQRQSRDFDLRGQLDSLTSRISGRVRNITCVMQELGYLDENLEPNYEKIAERINLLPIGEELKKDMVEGISYCKQFSQCVPDVNKEKFPMSRELAKPMFFFRCYKHKKLEACVMKDVRDRYTHNEDNMAAAADVDSMAGGELRSMASTKNDEYEDMALSMYEFMYGNGNSDFDSDF